MNSDATDWPAYGFEVYAESESDLSYAKEFASDNYTGAAVAKPKLVVVHGEGVAPPTPSFTSKPASCGNNSTPSFAWTTLDNSGGSGVDANSRLLTTDPNTVTGQSLGTPVGSWTAPTQSDGYYYFSVRNRDAESNWSGVVQYGFGIDTTAPGAPPSITPDQWHQTGQRTNKRAVGFAWSGASDTAGACAGVVGYGVSVDQQAAGRGSGTSESYVPDQAPGNPGAGGSTTVTLPTNSFDGSYYIHVRARDAAGNYGAYTDSGPFVLDTMVPASPTSVSSPTHPAGQPVSSQNVSLTWSGPTPVNQEVLSYRYHFWPTGGGSTVVITDNSTSTPSLSTHLDDGSWEVYVATADDAGNLSDPPAHYGPIVVDTGAPAAVTSLASTSHSVGAPSSNRVIAVAWQPSTSADKDHEEYCFDQVNARTAFNPCPAPGTLSPATVSSADSSPWGPLGDGNWYAHVRVVDRAGNRSDYADAGPYTVDGTAPAAPLNLRSSSHPVGVPRASRSIQLQWDPPLPAGDATSYSFAFDTSATRPDSTPLSSDLGTTNGLSATINVPVDDQYYLYVRARDAAGNTGPYARYGPVVINSSLAVITKTITTNDVAGVYARGQSLTYVVHVANPSTKSSMLVALTDQVHGAQALTGTHAVLTRQGETGAGVDCLGAGAANPCTVDEDAGTLTLNNLWLGAGQWLELTYTTLATGAESGCAAADNTAKAINEAGTAQASVAITVCGAGLGLEPWWSYWTHPVGPAAAVHVNAMNGNAVVTDTDSTPTPARGRLGYSLRRTYNSQDSAILNLPGALAPGWVFNLGATDELAGLGVTPMGLGVPDPRSVLAPGAVTLIDRDGTRHIFGHAATTVALTLDVASLTQASTLSALRPTAPGLQPGTLPGQSGFPTVCIDTTYQAPAGVHLGVWRYVGTSGTCSQLSSGTFSILGYAALRPDRLRSEFDAFGRLIDLVDGSGVDLRYSYDLQGRLTQVWEPRSCLGTVGSDTCRGVLLTYSDTTGCEVPTIAGVSGLSRATCVSDVAGRRTVYGFAGSGHLLVVVNPPETGGAGMGGADHTVYTYGGINGAPSCGGTAGQLCTIQDPRGNITRFTYRSGAVGLPPIDTVTDRRGTTTTFSYDPNGTATAADTGTHRVAFRLIDAAGRVGRIEEGAVGSAPIRSTDYTWDGPGTASCTYLSDASDGPSTARLQRPDNALCAQTRVAAGSATRATRYTYTPEGAVLTETRAVGGGAPDVVTSYGYTTQYVIAGSTPQVVTDQPAGSGRVSVGDRRPFVPATTGAPTAGPVLFALTDRTAALTPNGNAAADWTNYLTTWTTASNPAAAPNTDPGVADCTARNTGSICVEHKPYASSPGTGRLDAVTTFTYDRYGQKTSQTVPGRTGATYTYDYYPAGSVSLAGHGSTEGWLRAVVDPTGHFAFFSYDAAGNTVRSWDRKQTSGTPASFAATAAVNASTTPAGAAEQLHATSLTAPPWRYVLSSTDPVGNHVSYTVDADGNTRQSTDARGYTTTSTFDAEDHPTSLLKASQSLGSHRAWTFSYDAWGNLTRTVSPLGAQTGTSYDPVNRPTAELTERAATGTPPAGCRLATAADPVDSGLVACVTTRDYDAADNTVTSTDQAGAQTTNSYDGLGRLLTTTTPGHNSWTTLASRRVYDADGNLTDLCPPRSVTDGGAAACSPTDPYGTHTRYDIADRPLTVTTYRAGTAHTTTTSYDPTGNPVTVTDPQGHVTTNTYDVLNRLTATTRPRSAGTTTTTRYGYDAVGNRTYVLGATTLDTTGAPPAAAPGIPDGGVAAALTAPRITVYTYDADNRLSDTVRGASDTTGTWHAPSADGGTNIRTRLAYDPDGRIVAAYDPRAFAASSQPDPRFMTRTDYDPDGRVSAQYRPRYDNLTSADPALSATQTGQCPTGVAAQSSARPAIDNYTASTAVTIGVCRVRYSYDDDGRRTTVTLPTATASGNDNRHLDYSYSPDGLLLTVTAPDPASNSGGRITAITYDYDANGRRTAATPATGPSSATSYFPDGLVDTVTRTAGTSPHVESHTYNANGQPTATTRTVGGGTQTDDVTSYASDGTTASTADAAGNLTSYRYDAVGNTTAVTSPNANAHDPANPAGTPTTYLYTDDNLIAQTLTPVSSDGTSRLRRTRYSYDAAGRRISSDTDIVATAGTTLTVLTDGPAQTQSYYPDDRLSAETGRTNDTITYRYDPAGNPTTTSYTNAANTNVVISTQTYYLDGLARSYTERGRTQRYAYDGAGTRVASSDTDTTPVTGTTTKTVLTTNDAGLPTAATSDLVSGTLTTWQYDHAGRVTTQSNGNGTTLARSYNPDGTLAAETLTGPAGSIADWHYQYDGLYRVTDAALNTTATCTTGTPVNGLHCYDYDTAGRLISFRDATATRTATYDADGNRLSYGAGDTSTTARTVHRTYNADDSIATTATGTAPAKTSGYAPWGGLLTDGNCQTNTYDGFDRLTSTTSAGTGCTLSTITYTYNGTGRQTSRTETGTGATTPGTTTYHYDNPQASTLAAQTNPDSSTTRYAAAPNGTTLAAKRDGLNGATQYLTGDGRGNVTTYTNTSGTLACQQRFDPWGTPLDTAPGQPAGQTCSNTGGRSIADIGYDSERRDTTTGTYQLGARTYDPNQAGFLQPDTMRTGGSAAPLAVGVDPLTRNTYTYVNGDPVNLSDPSGHCAARSAEDVCQGVAISRQTHRLRRDAAIEVALVALHEAEALLQQRLAYVQEVLDPQTQYINAHCDYQCLTNPAAYSAVVAAYKLTDLEQRFSESRTGQAVLALGDLMGTTDLVNGNYAQFALKALALISMLPTGEALPLGNAAGRLALAGGRLRAAAEGAEAVAGGTRIARITPGSLPSWEESAVDKTVGYIDSGTTPSGPLATKWGTPFRNWDRYLPGGVGENSPYLEYRVAPPPGTSGAGPLRVVYNPDSGDMYYTWTHYGDGGYPPFVQIR